MLDKDRREIYEQIKYKIDNDLNGITDTNGAYVDNNSYYQTHYGVNGINISGPSEMVGWPPEIAEYIRRMGLMITKEILDSIYTEEEIDQAKIQKLYTVFFNLKVT